MGLGSKALYWSPCSGRRYGTPVSASALVSARWWWYGTPVFHHPKIFALHCPRSLAGGTAHGSHIIFFSWIDTSPCSQVASTTHHFHITFFIAPTFLHPFKHSLIPMTSHFMPATIAYRATFTAACKIAMSPATHTAACRTLWTGSLSTTFGAASQG